jgi:hypothetical protein
MHRPDDSYRYEVFLSASDLPEPERAALVKQFYAIATPYWREIDPDRCRAIERSFFEPGSGVGVARARGEMVGFYAFRRLMIGTTRVLCPLNIHIAEAHQRRGIRTEFSRMVMRAVLADGAPLYYGFRTRTPLLWKSAMTRCKVLVPSLFGEPADPALLEFGERVVKTLYPDAVVEMPALVLRDAYRGFLYHEEPHHADDAYDAAFYAPLTSKYDARFFFGEVDPARVA